MTLGSQIEGATRPRLFGTEVGLMAGLSKSQRPKQIKIEPIANQMIGASNGGIDLGRTPCGLPRPNANDRQRAARPTDTSRIDPGRRPRHGDGGPPTFLLRDDQFRPDTSGGERGSFRDTPASGRLENRFGWRGQTGLLSGQSIRIKKTRRHT